jgi:hypothetical protein
MDTRYEEDEDGNDEIDDSDDESDLETDLYSGSTLIAIKTSPIVGSVLDDFKKSTTSL